MSVGRAWSASSGPAASASRVWPGSSSSTSTGLQELILWHDGRSPSYGEGITFWALGEMVRERAGLREGDDEAGDPGEGRGDRRELRRR